MKRLLTFALVGLSTLTFAGDKGNGGDPYEIYATNFSDHQKIEAATKLVEEKLYESNLPRDFSDEVLNEMISLKRNDRFRYIGNVIVLPGSGQSFGHHVPSEEGQFLGLGAFTQNKKGAQVYFTERTLSHSEEDFAKLVLHEVAHHILPSFLTRDEGFIERLVEEVWQKDVSELLQKSLEHGYYLPRGEFTRERVLMALVMTKKRCYFQDGEVWGCYNYLKENIEKLPENVWDMNMSTFMDSDYFKKFFSEGGRYNEPYYWLRGALRKLGYEFIEEDHFCVKSEGSWIFYRCLEERKVSGIIK